MPCGPVPAATVQVQAVLQDRSKANDEVAEIQLVQYTVRLGYGHLLAEDVLGYLLPSDITVPSGHEEVGHIVHLNLRTEHHPYRHLIAHVLLEKVCSTASPNLLHCFLHLLGTNGAPECTRNGIVLDLHCAATKLIRACNMCSRSALPSLM